MSEKKEMKIREPKSFLCRETWDCLGDYKDVVIRAILEAQNNAVDVAINMAAEEA